MQAMTPIYIERPPVEETCRQAIKKPRGLVRIKAPQKMGKTLLLRKTLDYARSLGYRTASIDFSEWGPNNSIFNDYDQFQRSLCIEISKCLQIKDEDIERNISETWGIRLSQTKPTNYFQDYLLSQGELVVGFDRFEVLFDKLKIFEDFCCLLRAWHEKTELQWQNLKLILVNSTDEYPELDINHSPFNVGIGVDELTGLTGFSPLQAKELLKFYLQEDSSRTDELILKDFVDFVGGHPFLLDESFKYLRRNPTQTLQQVKEESPTKTGIFNHHLAEILKTLTLDSHQDLKDDYIKIIQQYPNSVDLPQKSAFNLRSLGLIKNADNGRFVSSCDLYRLYFILSLFMQEVGKLLRDISPDITEEEARTLVSNRLNDNLKLGNNKSKWSLVLRRNFFNRDRLFQSSRAAFFAVIDYYITDSPVGKAAVAFFEEWSDDE
ncbi:AAA-like domain-containing protein [Microcystis aeruginosa]|uniref:Genome sequencing data, contig C269 n=2 Tax=Microcystis aeruginosa (strain PCC 7806) TaxID=267872 RepID=A8YB97_MICA7|nr:AAA-like domain-containing protein [Microcystis aeruginosa]TRU01906.1 MAG: hypothetical protein EWV61_11960 [Microcystis aeruginosa Ma_AC_P_19900807_S300]ARI82842.1 hypothetical protein BH695_3563 [Microcystis aeruginosa PCC 7806SL]ELS49025.1 hypothetical protein C789_1173 [Microcystis aeruginosa FACHB-905 = DIANCHI905]UGS10352.1 AAA-like domain-containing protein [Microcystis aeruginosa FACHB-905 = DIANCHI905]WKX61447.1 AAA-like domain-containing protein [Microcystis aeruginosa PCC 7806]